MFLFYKGTKKDLKLSYLYIIGIVNNIAKKRSGSYSYN